MRDTPDRELAILYSIFDDYNQLQKGVTLQDFLECREMMQKSINSKRASYKISPSKPNSLFLEDRDYKI